MADQSLRPTAAASGVDDPPTNVLLVTVDSLRADAVFGPDRERVAPTMRRLAADGAAFERAFAHGNWTPFSFPSLLGPRPVFADGPRPGVATPTLAATLREAGVRTVGFNAANGFLTPHWGYDRGFDRFDPFMRADTDSAVVRSLSAHPTAHAWVRFLRSSVEGALPGESAARSADADVESAARSFLTGRDPSGEPFFLWVHFMDAHTPYLPAPRHLRAVTGRRAGTLRTLRAHLRAGLGRSVSERTLSDLRALYHASVRQVDARIGRLLAALDSAGIREETAVVLAGDHGEEFQEHGHLAHYPKLYDELVRVPLVVDAPGAPGRRVRSAVGLDAVPPTVCDLLGAPTPAAFEGESLAGAVGGGDAGRRGPVVSVAVRGETVTQQPIPRRLDEGRLLVSARDDAWACIADVAAGTYDLRPLESAAVDGDAGPDPRTERRLRAAVDRRAARLDDAGSAAEGPTADPPAAVADRLTALGYR
jgi:arylsulfatase A-like enzyme